MAVVSQKKVIFFFFTWWTVLRTSYCEDLYGPYWILFFLLRQRPNHWNWEASFCPLTGEIILERKTLLSWRIKTWYVQIFHFWYLWHKLSHNLCHNLSGLLLSLLSQVWLEMHNGVTCTEHEVWLAHCVVRDSTRYSKKVTVERCERCGVNNTTRVKRVDTHEGC